jgi:hypothetical protein
VVKLKMAMYLFIVFDFLKALWICKIASM